MSTPAESGSPDARICLIVPSARQRKTLSKIMVTPNGCWIWMSTRNQKGYGAIVHKGRKVTAHRFIYMLMVGVGIEAGFQLDHLCRDPSCVNPFHLEPVTGSENCRRGRNGMRLALKELSKTHCPKGHAYTGKNLMVDKAGWRRCRICRSATKRRAWLKRRAHVNSV